MPIILRKEKGSALTIEELDGNFSDLNQRIKSLETTPVLAEGIGKITQSGDQLTVVGTYGTFLGTFVLPKSFPNPRGDWIEDTSYLVNDWVVFKEGLYVCTTPHTSKVFKLDYWQKIFGKEPEIKEEIKEN